MVKKWIIKCNRSFQIIEDKELNSLFTYLEPTAVGKNSKFNVLVML